MFAIFQLYLTQFWVHVKDWLLWSKSTIIFAPNIYFVNYKILYFAQNFFNLVSWGKVSALPNNLDPCFHGCSDVCLVASPLRQTASPYLMERGGEDVHDWQVQIFIHGKVEGENLVCCKVRSHSLQAPQEEGASGVIEGTLQEGVLQAVHRIHLTQVTQGGGGHLHSE